MSFFLVNCIIDESFDGRREKDKVEGDEKNTKKVKGDVLV